MLRAYCIRRAADTPPPAGLRGVDGAEVTLLRVGGLGAWVSEGEPLPATAERLREHDAVVRAALRAATPLPVRFGTTFLHEPAARDALTERAAEFEAALQRVAGRVEVGVQVRWKGGARRPVNTVPPAEEPALHSGAEYLRRRREELERDRALRARAATALDGVEAAFAALHLPTTRTVVASAETAGILAHLVRRDHARAYRLHADRVRRRLTQLDLVFSGPWAPYSFV